MNTKTTILVFIDWFWPGYLAGGPVQSIVSMINCLGGDFNFKILTTDRDLNSERPYIGVETNKWISIPMGCEVYYADPHSLNYVSLKKIISETTFDIAYINSFFSKNFSIVALQILNKHRKNTPIILAPRGMLGDGALALKKYKKKAFLFYSKLTGLHKNVIWHATSAQEEGEIKKNFHPKREIKTISNLPKKIVLTHTKTKNAGEIKLCFISRISEKKNLDFALHILSKIKDKKINYNIYGPIEDLAYWEKCEAIIRTLPSNIIISYKGIVNPESIESVLANEHMMFLPTLNENFGHSIVESLLCGCPVVISDQTPWNDLEEHQAGYAISLTNEQKFIDVLKSCADLNQEQYSVKSQHANNYISKKIDLKKIISQYENLFNDCIKN